MLRLELAQIPTEVAWVDDRTIAFPDVDRIRVLPIDKSYVDVDPNALLADALARTAYRLDGTRLRVRGIDERVD